MYDTPQALMTGIADAIREKKGKVGTINHQDMPNEILSIQGGGGGSLLGSLVYGKQDTLPLVTNAIYNIADYQELADYIRNTFGSYNHFGGDGVTTFGMPDMGKDSDGLVPKLTSSTATKVINSAQYNSSYAGWCSFSQVTSNECSLKNTVGAYIGYDFDKPTGVNCYKIRARTTSTSLAWMPTAWDVQGRNSDDEEWTTISHETGISWSVTLEEKFFFIPSSQYCQYRLLVTEDSTNTQYTALNELQFYSMFGMETSGDSGSLGKIINPVPVFDETISVVRTSPASGNPAYNEEWDISSIEESGDYLCVVLWQYASASNLVWNHRMPRYFYGSEEVEAFDGKTSIDRTLTTSSAYNGYGCDIFSIKYNNTGISTVSMYAGTYYRQPRLMIFKIGEYTPKEIKPMYLRNVESQHHASDKTGTGWKGICAYHYVENFSQLVGEGVTADNVHIETDTVKLTTSSGTRYIRHKIEDDTLYIQFQNNDIPWNEAYANTFTINPITFNLIIF